MLNTRAAGLPACPDDPPKIREVTHVRPQASLAGFRAGGNGRRRCRGAERDDESGIRPRRRTPISPISGWSWAAPSCPSPVPTTWRPRTSSTSKPGTKLYPDLTFYQATPAPDGFGNGLFTPEGAYPLFGGGVQQLYYNYPLDSDGLASLSTSVGQGAAILESTILSRPGKRRRLNGVRLLAEFHAIRRHDAAARPVRHARDGTA